MTELIVSFALGILIGWIVRPWIQKHKHKHRYQVVLHRKLGEIGINTVLYKVSAQEREQGHKIDFDSVYVSCKQCKTCDDIQVNVSDGTSRHFDADHDFIRDKVEITLAAERKQKEQEWRDSKVNTSP